MLPCDAIMPVRHGTRVADRRRAPEDGDRGESYQQVSDGHRAAEEVERFERQYVSFFRAGEAVGTAFPGGQEGARSRRREAGAGCRRGRGDVLPKSRVMHSSNWPRSCDSG
jgi:hypothetical protein